MLGLGANGIAIYDRDTTGICDPASPNYNPTACELSHCDPASPNYDVLACERSRCDATSPDYDPAQCDPATTDPTVAAYYTFGDLLGHSPNGNNLTLQEGASLSNGMLVLPGSGYDEEGDSYFYPHATVANSPSLNPQYITVAARVKFTSDFTGCGVDAIVCKPYTSHVAPYYQYILGTTGTYCNCSGDHTFVFICTINGKGYGFRALTPKWVLDQWYTVVATYDGATMKLYVNGTLAATNPVAGTLSSYPTDMFIGKHGNLNYCIPADMEWIKIYNRALTAAEVSALSGK